MPANRAALYTIKPSVGLVSQAGLVPGSDFCDAVGPLAKTAIDIAHILDAMVDSPQLQHRLSGSYVAHADRSWKGVKIGMVDPALWPLSRNIGGDDKSFDAKRVCPFLVQSLR
jgi:amidase